MTTTSLLLAGFGLLAVTLCPSNRVQCFTLDMVRFCFRGCLALFLLISCCLCLFPERVPDGITNKLYPLAEPLTGDFGDRFRWLAMAAIICLGTMPALVCLDFLSILAHHAQFDRQTRENSQRLLSYLFGDNALETPRQKIIPTKKENIKSPVRRLGEYLS